MDVLHDNAFKSWIQIGNAHEADIPDYVMNYAMPSKEDAIKIADELFADPVRRLYPLDSAPAAWLSAAYFSKHATEQGLPYKVAEEKKLVWDTIQTAGDVFDIKEDIDKIALAIQKNVKTIEAKPEDNDENYGWILRKDGEIIDKKYPMFDARGVEKAAEYFGSYRQRYPLNIRRNIARKIMDKAAEYGIEQDKLDQAVLKEAGYGIPQKEVLMDELLERAHLTKDAESAVALANINEMIASTPTKELGENLDKIAEVLEAFDRDANLVSQYGKKILMPADILFGINLKTAEDDIENMIELDKYVFSTTKLAELPVNVFTNVLGEDFGKEIMKKGATTIDNEKLSDKLFALSQSDKIALEEHLETL